MIRLSVPLRQALAKLTLPVFIVASFGLMLLGKADALLAERARMAVADALAPLYAALAEPLSGSMKHDRMRRVVVLPAPLGPMKPTMSPFFASKDTSSRATTSP